MAGGLPQKIIKSARGRAKVPRPEDEPANRVRYVDCSTPLRRETFRALGKSYYVANVNVPLTRGDLKSRKSNFRKSHKRGNVDRSTRLRQKR